MRTLLATLFLLSLGYTNAYAQIYYEIEYNKDLDSYVLSMHSEKTWAKAPFNRTSTAQVTIKAPTGSFYPNEVKSLIPNVLWEHNSSYEAPKEEEDYDYFSFGLVSTGTDIIEYEKGAKIPIISFKNKLDCAEKVSLIDNETDPFMYPNSSGANIGNHITVLGSFKTNSYAGNINNSGVNCPKSLRSSDFLYLKEHFAIYPNPVETTTTLSSMWPLESIEARADLLDLTGRIVSSKNISLQKGDNAFEFDLTNENSGIYYIKLSNDEWDITLDGITKIKQ